MRLAIMDTNAFNTIIAAVKGAVSASISRPMYKNIRLEFRKKNKAVTAIATDGVRLFVEHATCCEVEEDFDCYIKPSIRLPRGNSMRLELKERDKTESVVEIECLGCIFGFVQPVGAFLDWEKVLPNEPTFRIGVNAEYLLSTLQAAKASVGGAFKQPATRKDFETKNRKKFCGRIATGDYDAVIIGHSQFEKIPMSVERQRAILEQQIDEIMMGISEAKREKAENFTIKQMMKTQKGLQAKIDKLNDQSRKDDVVTFEELGVDRIFIDESHYFKNLFLYTKMRNVGGIAQTEAQKSSDLFMKCRYLDEITGGRGIVFATGTPISNSMVELYTIQRYLQMSALEEQGLQHFDSWAANYGETVTAIELSPEGYTLIGR